MTSKIGLIGRSFTPKVSLKIIKKIRKQGFTVKTTRELKPTVFKATVTIRKAKIVGSGTRRLITRKLRIGSAPRRPIITKTAKKFEVSQPTIKRKSALQISRAKRKAKGQTQTRAVAKTLSASRARRAKSRR